MFFFTFQEAVAEDDEDANTYLVVSPSASGKNMNVTEGNKPNTNLTITGKHVVASTDEDSSQINVEKTHTTHAHTSSIKASPVIVQSGLSDTEKGSLLSIVNKSSKPSPTEVRYKDLMKKESDDDDIQPETEISEKPAKASVYEANEDSSSSDNEKIKSEEKETDEDKAEETVLVNPTPLSVQIKLSADIESQDSENEEDLKEDAHNEEEIKLEEQSDKDVEPKDDLKGDNMIKPYLKKFFVKIILFA